MNGKITSNGKIYFRLGSSDDRTMTMITGVENFSTLIKQVSNVISLFPSDQKKFILLATWRASSGVALILLVKSVLNFLIYTKISKMLSLTDVINFSNHFFLPMFAVYSFHANLTFRL